MQRSGLGCVKKTCTSRRAQLCGSASPGGEELGAVLACTVVIHINHAVPSILR